MVLSNKQYDILKLIALIILPISELVSSLASIWGLPYGSQIVATLVAVDTFLGALVKICSDKYHSEPDDDADMVEDGGIYDYVEDNGDDK